MVREPDKYAALPGEGVRLVAGDVTDRDSVARVAAGHDAAISAVYDAGAEPAAFFTSASQALLSGLPQGGVGRLLVVGLASVLPDASGVALMDTPGYPQEYRSFYLAHAAGAQVLGTAGSDLDWLIVSPAGDFDHDGEHSGRYRTAAADAASRISYPDFAVVLVDEVDAPKHHRMHLGVEGC